MEQAEIPRVIPIFLLSALMVIAGAHLLETVSHAVGLVDVGHVGHDLGESPESNGWNLGDFPPVQVYRYVAATVFLVVPYLCLSFNDMARRWLVMALVFDLGVWFIYSGCYLLFGSGAFPLVRMGIQVLVVGLEGVLLWVLTHPGARRHFVSEGNRVKIVS